MGRLQYVTISGSYRKFPDEIALSLEAFRDLDVTVLSPKSAIILASVDGFVSLYGDLIPRIDNVSENDIEKSMKLIENSHLQAIQQSDALWIDIPGGYCGAATSFEIGWALAHNVPVFYDGKYFSEVDEPIIQVYAHPTRGIEHLVYSFDSMPQVDPMVLRYFMRTLVESTCTQSNNADIAVGPVIVDYSDKRYRSGQQREILLVRTHKWGDKFSIVGGRLRKREKIEPAFSRIIGRQTSLDGVLADDVCVFDEIPDSGYFESGTSRVFVDKVYRAVSREVKLDSRAQEYLWIPPGVALRDLDIEPNAKKTIEIYHQGH